MSQSHALRFAFDNCFADRLGDSPLALERGEILLAAKEANEIHKAVMAQRKAGGLAFLNLTQQEGVAAKIGAFVQEKSSTMDTYVNLGIGGSSLGAIALMGLKNPGHNELDADTRDGMRCYFPENVDPVTFGSLLNRLDPQRTLFGVISKSGSTAETMSQYLIVHRWLTDQLGAEKVREHLFFITDKKAGFLRPIAEAQGIPTFEVPDGVGGRFSVLSPVGLVPAACAGIDIANLLEGARAMEVRCQSGSPETNPALLASMLYLRFLRKGAPISVLMPYADALFGLARWYVQLVSESLGKRVNRKGAVVNTGFTPLPAVGATDQHSQVQLFMEGPFDKFITFLAIERHAIELVIPETPKGLEGLDYLTGHRLGALLEAEQRATEMALSMRGRPNMHILLPTLDELSMGQLLYFFQLVTVYLGEWLDIDAFDQPGVELGKDYTYGLMGRKGYESKAEEVATFFGKKE